MCWMRSGRRLIKKNAQLVCETPALRGRRVLLAEDVSVHAEIMMMALPMREMEADLAQNGRVAAEKFAGNESGYYDDVLMDMRMPETDGLEATRLIRAVERGRESHSDHHADGQRFRRECPAVNAGRAERAPEQASGALFKTRGGLRKA